jgi:hypothetical protein
VLLGVVSVGCGGESASSARSSPGGEHPPTSADQPPNSASDPVPNSDDTPSSSDAPPGSADAPAGAGGSGRLVDVCQRFCRAFEDLVGRCSMPDDMIDVGEVCPDDTSCQVPANYPCLDEATKVFDCLIDTLENVCVDQQQVESNFCEAELKLTTDCAKANGLDDGSDDDDPPGNDDPRPTDCAGAGQDACSICICNAGSDPTKQQACIMGACAP